MLAVEVVGAPQDVGSYDRLLPTLTRSSDDPMFGAGTEDYAITRGLTLSAAVLAGDQATIESSGAWLDDDRSEHGWGTAWTWDPFSDGSDTPAGTPYAITTALAINGLMDAGLDDVQAAQVGRVLVHWASAAWSDGYYWYSLAPQDAIDVSNVNAMLAGQTARFIAEYGAEALTREDEALLRGRVEDSFGHLAATARPGLRWGYASVQPIVNDTQHHSYVLWGGEVARDAGFDPGWSRDEAIASLDAYGPVYPPDVVKTPDMQRRDGSPWEVSGTGSALAWSARWGGDLLRWSAALCEALDVTVRVARFDAHALLAMASIGWCDCPARQPLLPGVVRSC